MGKTSKTAKVVPVSARAALSELRKGLEKTYFKGVITTLSDTIQPIPVIPTGVVSFDKALTVGGFPRGRITELYGPPGGGKTTLTLHTIAQAQHDFLCLFLDFEHTLDPAYAKALGVNFSEEKFQFAQPESLEEGVDILNRFISAAPTVKLGLVVIDSIAAMAGRKEIDGEDITTTSPGFQSRLVAQSIKALHAKIAKYNVCVLAINQIRSKIGTLGSTETTPGGNALKHYAAVRCQVRRSKLNEIRSKKEGSPNSPVKFGELEVTVRAESAETRFYIVKSKVGNPFRCGTATLDFGKGYNRIKDFWEVARVNSLFTVSGKYQTWTVSDAKNEYELKFKDYEDFRQVFIDRPEFLQHAYNTLMKSVTQEVIDPISAKVQEPVLPEVAAPKEETPAK